MFVGINIANSLGRTSGGRYIAPVDWLVIPIFVAGILFLFGSNNLPIEKVKEIEPDRAAPGFLRWLKITLLVLFIAASPLIFESIFKGIYRSQQQNLSLDQVLSDARLSLSKKQIDIIDSNLKLENSRFVEGIVYFPTHQRVDQLFDAPGALLNVSEEKVITFYLMREKSYDSMYFPTDRR